MECALIKPAPRMVQLLLHDVMVVCPSCKRSIKAIEYDAHCCSEVSKQEMQLVSTVVHDSLHGASGMCITENTSKYFHIIFNYIPIL